MWCRRTDVSHLVVKLHSLYRCRLVRQTPYACSPAIDGSVLTVVHDENNGHNITRTIAVALDMSKAFDTVNIHTLIDKLTQANIPHTILRYISNYIKGRMAYTTFRNHTSTKRQFKSGVPQGGVLSPILFNIYTSDIPLLPDSVQLTTYADDITITAPHTDINIAKANIQPYLQDVLSGQKTTTYFSTQTRRHAHYSPQTQQNTTHN